MDGSPVGPRLLVVSPTADLRYGESIHKSYGNALLAEGSVQALSSARLQHDYVKKVPAQRFLVP